MTKLLLSLSIFLIFSSCNKEKSLESVKIGDHEWMISNLNTTEFQNGEKIFQAKNEKEWLLAGEEERAAWCYYNFNQVNENKGKVYNWYAATDPRLIAPKGWHVPTKGEHYTLYRKMNTKAANASNNPKLIEFYKIPTGILEGGNFMYTSYNVSFLWTSSEYTNGYGRAVNIVNDKYSYENNNREFPKFFGLFIKCLKNK
jgi:uncharacterized protein (TIGR02145 family)